MFDINAFKRPLDSHLHKKYIEQLVYLLLEHIFPEFASTFDLLDSPDLQTKDKFVGIEITEAVSSKVAQISGEHTKLLFGKTSELEKDKCKRKIEKNGGKVDSIGLSYPVTNSNEQWSIFSNAVIKKLELLPSYKEKGFKKMGLFILFDEPPIPFNPEIAMERFARIQSEYMHQYDCIFLGYRNGVIDFDFVEMKYEIHTIGAEAFDNLSLSARKIVEGKS